MTLSKRELGFLLARGILIVIAKSILIFLVFAGNIFLLWSFVRSGHRIAAESPSPIFEAVVVTPNDAELFLIREELDEYLDTHPAYSFLIPASSEAAVQEQIQASYHRKYGKGQPYLKIKNLGTGRQLIELTVAGDPHDNIFWYKASERKIEPTRWLIFSAFDPLLIVIFSPFLILPEYLRCGIFSFA